MITDNTEEKMRNVIYHLERQYPDYPTTFGSCCLKACTSQLSARGGGKCAACLESELAELTSEAEAKQLHELVKDKAALTSELLDNYGSYRCRK